MIENELKYVLNPVCLEEIKTALGKPKFVRQGYLPGNARIRLLGDQYWFTYKLPVNGSVFEIEKEITHAEFDRLWPHTKERLTKERFIAQYGDVHWDIDFFLDDDQMYFAMAEAEMPEDMDVPPVILPLLEPHIIYAVPRPLSKNFSSKRIGGDPTAARLILRGILGPDKKAKKSAKKK